MQSEQFSGILVPLTPRRLWDQSLEGFSWWMRGLRLGQRENKSLLRAVDWHLECLQKQTEFFWLTNEQLNRKNNVKPKHGLYSRPCEKAASKRHTDFWPKCYGLSWMPLVPTTLHGRAWHLPSAVIETIPGSLPTFKFL
jgi:hypothetical protein